MPVSTSVSEDNTKKLPGDLLISEISYHLAEVLKVGAALHCCFKTFDRSLYAFIFKNINYFSFIRFVYLAFSEIYW